jgi:hypothetical protein
VAIREGGPQNGVLTALEDFLAGREDLRVAILPLFFGVGFVWPASASWSGRVGGVLEPLASSPVVERLEGNRVHHIAFGHQLYTQILALHARVDELEAQNRRQREELTRIAGSRAFAIAQRLSRLRPRRGS